MKRRLRRPSSFVRELFFGQIGSHRERLLVLVRGAMPEAMSGTSGLAGVRAVCGGTGSVDYGHFTKAEPSCPRERQQGAGAGTSTGAREQGAGTAGASAGDEHLAAGLVKLGR